MGKNALSIASGISKRLKKALPFLNSYGIVKKSAVSKLTNSLSGL